MDSLAQHEEGWVPTCPKCGTTNCGHTQNEMQIFAYAALAEMAEAMEKDNG